MTNSKTLLTYDAVCIFDGVIHGEMKKTPGTASKEAAVENTQKRGF